MNLKINPDREKGTISLKNPCVNKQVAGRTQQQYYVDKHDKILDQKKQYDDVHNEQKTIKN